MPENAKDVVQRLGRQARAARRARGLIQADVGNRSGVERYVVAKIETGNANSRLDTMVAVGDAVGLSLVYVPTERLEEVLKLVGQPRIAADVPAGAGAVYDDVFVEPGQDDEPETPRGP